MQAPKHWNVKLSTNWTALIFLTALPFITAISVIWYAWNYGVHASEVIFAIVVYFITGLGVTAGYHRYYSHRTHDAHPITQIFYLIFGAMTMQERALQWSRNHRIHHRYTDTELDPHNIKQGFFHAHMGWIFQNRPIDRDFSTVKDLQKDPLVMWQDKYYWQIFAVSAVIMPFVVGYFFDRPLGFFIWGGLVRVLLQNHTIYSINSIAHTWGKQRFSLKYEARDSWLLALISNGEGFHSFHHRFAFDYRNGWLWYHWDPSKWFIRGLSYLGLTANLKTASETSILLAKVNTDIQRAKQVLEKLPAEKKTTWEQRLTEAQAQFEALVNQWEETKQRFREYKQMRKERALAYSRAEYLALKNKLLAQKRALSEAQANWTALAHSIQFSVA